MLLNPLLELLIKLTELTRDDEEEVKVARLTPATLLILALLLPFKEAPLLVFTQLLLAPFELADELKLFGMTSDALPTVPELLMPAMEPVKLLAELLALEMTVFAPLALLDKRRGASSLFSSSGVKLFKFVALIA